MAGTVGGGEGGAAPTGPCSRPPSRTGPGVPALVGVVGVVAVVAVAVVWADRPLAALALAGFVVVLGLLSAVDVREHRLPNRIVGPLTLATVAVVGLHGLIGGDRGRVAGSLVAAASLSAAFLVISLVGQLGMGDVKLAFPVGLVMGWLGHGALPAMGLVALVSSAVMAVAMLVRGGSRHDTLPFGPFLALGAVAGILVAGLA